TAPIFAVRLAVSGSRTLMDQVLAHQLVAHGRDTTGAIIIFAEILARRLQVRELWHIEPKFLPIRSGQLDSQMPGKRIEVERCVGRAADGTVDADRIDETFA